LLGIFAIHHQFDTGHPERRQHSGSVVVDENVPDASPFQLSGRDIGGGLVGEGFDRDC